MGPGLRASLAGAVLTVVACGSAFTSSPGGDGGTDASTTETGGPDAATDSTSADSSSGGADASMPEGGAGDGPIVGDGGSVSSYCAMHPGAFTFCEDFDSYTSLTQLYGQWPNFSTTGGSFSFVNATALSPPNSLQAVTSSMSGVRTLLIHPMPAAGSGLSKRRLELDFYIDDVTTIGIASAAAVAAIVFGNDVSAGAVAVAFSYSLSANPSLAAIYLGPQPDSGIPEFGSSNAPPPFPSTGQWDGRFAIEIDYGPSSANPDGGPSSPTACAQLFIGGVPQLSPCLALPASLSHPGPASIALGVYSGGAGNTGNVGVTFDNVTYVAQ